MRLIKFLLAINFFTLSLVQAAPPYGTVGFELRELQAILASPAVIQAMNSMPQAHFKDIERDELGDYHMRSELCYVKVSIHYNNSDLERCAKYPAPVECIEPQIEIKRCITDVIGGGQS